MDTLNKKDKIKELEKLASEVLKFKEERALRSPLLIEFCGSPKSGKSTIITALNIFLKRNGFQTVVLTERAGVCPVSNKRHPFFNIWTLTSAIAETIQHLDQSPEKQNKVDIIIADRGIFDALCWFNWLRNPEIEKPHVDEKTFETLKDFCLMEMWRRRLDLIYVFKVSPKTSIDREYANLLTEKRGSIMNEDVLKGFNESIDNTVKNYGKKFRKLTEIITDTPDLNNNPNAVSYEVTSSVLNILKEILIERIGYFNENIKNELKVGVNNVSKIENFQIEFDRRDKIEKSKNIQPIAIAVITNAKRNKVLVVKKSAKRTLSDSPESDRLLLYIGGHVREEDKDEDGNTIKTIGKTLEREIEEEIGEKIAIDSPNFFLIYGNDNPKSEKHLAFCYVIEMDLEDKRFKLTSEEFIMKTGTSKSGQILQISDIVSGNYKLESWSIKILKEVFKKDVSKKFTLFDPQED
ncbi:MAG TPA: hypothetical protein DCR40_15465 [Prolixibacteraceae bacterium]|nr:hypothetical protein [Prolixibacteraceae bacterium]